jgi:hexosaminidase
VTLAASDPDAEIFYTTDGTEPTTHSTRYDGPISVAATTKLKFMAVGPGGSEGDKRRSPVFTETYTVGG